MLLRTQRCAPARTLKAIFQAAQRLQDNIPIKHALLQVHFLPTAPPPIPVPPHLLQDQRALDSRKAVAAAAEVRSPKPQPLRRLAAGKILLVRWCLSISFIVLLLL